MAMRPETPDIMKNPSRPALVAHDLISLQKGLVELVPELRGRACRLCGDPTTADDIVQDTIERALKFAKQYEKGTNLRAWVYQILFSVFITRYRRSRRERNALKHLATDPCAWTMPERFAAPDASISLNFPRRSVSSSSSSISTTSPTARRPPSSASPSAPS
jgi:DNA-directed RNA polymerase specialized sigma24 family protein